jgi:hypothetical protein
VGDLGIGALADFPGDLVGQGARGRQLAGGVGEHPLDRLVLGERAPRRMALERPRLRELERALRGAEAPRGDHEPLVAEPVLGELHAEADPAEDGVRPHADVREADLGVAVDDTVGEARGPADGEAGRVAVHQEDRRAAPRPVDHVGHDHEEPRDVAAGGEPLLAGDDDPSPSGRASVARRLVSEPAPGSVTA